jgi:hypothetical protein
VWANLITVYGGVGSENEKRWVILAREGIERLDDQGIPIRPSGQASLIETVQPVIDESQRLRKAGMSKESDNMNQALEFLYRDDPELPTLHEMLLAEKGAKK